MFDCLVCHYGEIALKGKNRSFFEDQLVKNIKKALSREAAGCFALVKKISGRIIVILTPAAQTKEDKLKQALANVFGLVHFSFALSLEPQPAKLAQACLSLLRDKDFQSFRITSQRSEKSFPLTSEELNRQIGALVAEKIKKRVDLENPQATCFVEIVQKSAFVYLDRIKGLGGLPLGVSSQAVVLLSGGLDSPVAAFLTMKRGVQPIFVHFHALPHTSLASLDKVSSLVKTLNRFCFQSVLYLVPFGQIQEKIVSQTPGPWRVVLYRRFMLRIAQRIAQKEGAPALVTGESIGQVASQTLENIRVIEEVAQLPVLRPLIGFDKEEIIRQAKKIGTYQISILPDDDCCVRFLPLHPATKADLQGVRQAEEQLGVDGLVEEAIKKTERKVIGDWK